MLGRHALLFVAAAALTSAVPRGASAGSFAPDGSFLFDPAAVVALDFEDEVGDAGIVTLDDAHALSGRRVFSLAAGVPAELPITLPLVKATYRISLWIRDVEAAGALLIGYDANVDEIAALYPTGRVTSDGWIELAADHVRVDGGRAKSLTIGAFSPLAPGTVDAVEVVPDGGEEQFPTVANAPCDGVSDPSACSPGQVCVWNECRNATHWVPPIPADREDVTAYLEARLQMMFGPFLERTQDLPAAHVLLDGMHTAQDPYAYWSAFLTGVRRLHDGHTSGTTIADSVIPTPRPISVCLLEGDADLTHTVAPSDPQYLDVLVSHVGADHNLGLHAGDRIVHVDGQHPIAWARQLLAVYPAPGTSNHTTFAELASRLNDAISRFASSIDVVRCDAASGTCASTVDTISIRDLPIELHPVFDAITCDNRPLRHLPTSPADHATGEDVYAGIVTASDATEAIYGMEWESLYTTDGTDGPGAAINAAASSWRTGARGVILDHRTGTGGTVLGCDPIWNFAVDKYASDVYWDRQLAGEEQPTTVVGQAIFQHGLATQLATYVGSTTPVTDVPVALLTTQDVSYSDWLTQGLKGAANTKVFGPFQTNGGFSTRYIFGYWTALQYVVAVGDTVLPDGTTHNGRGVDPDVVVLPLQSDLVTGKDTLFEAALAWVRQGLKP